jgi:hypothetical protein
MSAAKTRCQLVLLHEAASHGISRLDALLAARAFPPHAAARLALQCGYLRAGRARIMARLHALGRPLTLAPPLLPTLGTPLQELEHLVQLCEVMAERLAKAAEFAWGAGDAVTGAACRLNRVEVLNVALELRALVEPERMVGT